MTDWWLASYVILWLLVAALCVVCFGLLQQVGLLQRSQDFQTAARADAHADDIPELQDDGPAIGSRLPELVARPINSDEAITPAALRGERGTMLVFLSPMCKSCQEVIGPLNTLADDPTFRVRIAAILRGDEQACQAFLNLFPLHAPVICDSDRSISMGLDIHRNPLALLYDAQGILIRKGMILGHDELRALRGDATVSARALSRIFPPLEVAAAETTVSA